MKDELVANKTVKTGQPVFQRALDAQDRSDENEQTLRLNGRQHDEH